MKLYKLIFKIIGTTTNKRIEILDVTETEKSFVFENKRISKNKIGEFDSNFRTDIPNIFHRNGYFLSIEDAENAIEKLNTMSKKHFLDITKLAQTSYDAINDEFENSKPIIKIID